VGVLLARAVVRVVDLEVKRPHQDRFAQTATEEQSLRENPKEVQHHVVQTH
jgi:hypothetical protein